MPREWRYEANPEGKFCTICSREIPPGVVIRRPTGHVAVGLCIFCMGAMIEASTGWKILNQFRNWIRVSPLFRAPYDSPEGDT